MKKNILKVPLILLLMVSLNQGGQLFAQNTSIRGFVDIGTKLEEDKVNFELGEYDLFITSDLNDHLSFLGETVFRYNQNTENFEVSVERAIIKYNYYGNHSLLIGKHHTPINYWNDTYHHGRVFFPTIDRPYLFKRNIIPLHTTGISLQGLNLGKLRFGYDLMVGNGIGSNDLTDNDQFKSITAAVHIKPLDRMRIGATFYHDVISEGADIHGSDVIINEKITQNLVSASIAYFGSKFELLAEGTMAVNNAQSTGAVNSLSSYLYAGYRIKEKIIPYFRIDNLNFQDNELYYLNNDSTVFVSGLRYEINYLAVLKLEYQYENISGLDNLNRIKLQIAIGF